MCACSSPGIELTDAENRQIAEYAAELLLKYDSNYDSKYYYEQDELEKLKESLTQETTEEVTTEAPFEEEGTTSEGNDFSDQESTTETISEEATDQSPPSEIGNECDIARIVGASGLSILYEKCLFLDRYPAIDSDGSFIYLEADPGYKLVILKFNVKNTTNENQSIDLLNTDISYHIIMNDSKTAKPMLTILMDDLSTFQTTLSANAEQSSVLVFQIQESLIDQIKSLFLRVTYNGEENKINLMN